MAPKHNCFVGRSYDMGAGMALGKGVRGIA